MRKVNHYDEIPKSIRKIAKAKVPGSAVSPEVYECNSSEEVYKKMKEEDLESIIHIDRVDTGRAFVVAMGIEDRMTKKVLEEGKDEDAKVPIMYFAELDPEERRWAIRKMTEGRKEAYMRSLSKRRNKELDRLRQLEIRARKLGTPKHIVDKAKEELGLTKKQMDEKYAELGTTTDLDRGNS